MSGPRALWDAEAERFDEAPDHGLREPRVRDAWFDLLSEELGPTPRRVADLGCGTGSLSRLLRDLGHAVVGLDLSPRMLALAREKCGPEVAFIAGDAGDPPLAPRRFDVILCRHVLWALPDPREVLARWARLLAGDGTIVMIEGRWSTGAGLAAADLEAALPSGLRSAGVRRLSGVEALWGGPVTDERYVLRARRA